MQLMNELVADSDELPDYLYSPETGWITWCDLHGLYDKCNQGGVK